MRQPYTVTLRPHSHNLVFNMQWGAVRYFNVHAVTVQLSVSTKFWTVELSHCIHVQVQACELSHCMLSTVYYFGVKVCWPSNSQMGPLQ